MYLKTDPQIHWDIRMFFGQKRVFQQPARLQAKVADMFATAATVSKATKHPLTIIFETHSETIVNRIGHLVANKKLAPEDVQVLLFEKESAESDTNVTQAKFGPDGVLQNWPHGFFLAAADDSEFPLQAEFPSDTH